MREIKNNYTHHFEDERGLYQAEYKKYYPNGSLEFHCYFKDDKRHGEYKSYYSGGQLYIHCFYKDGKLHGEYKKYFSDSSLSYIKYFSNGKDITDMYNKLQTWKKL